MTGVAGNGTPRYFIDIAPMIRTVIVKLQQQAIDEGRGRQFFDAFRKAMERIRLEPLRFGEPQYRLPGLRLKVRSALIAPIAIHFAVSEERPIVFIKAVKLLSAKDNS